MAGMEGGFGFPFGGDPEDLLRGLREFAEQQAESVQEAQREQFATLTLNTAVELTAAALSQLNVEGARRNVSCLLRDCRSERISLTRENFGVTRASVDAFAPVVGTMLVG